MYMFLYYLSRRGGVLSFKATHRAVYFVPVPSPILSLAVHIAIVIFYKNISKGMWDSAIIVLFQFLMHSLDILQLMLLCIQYLYKFSLLQIFTGFYL